MLIATSDEQSVPQSIIHLMEQILSEPKQVEEVWDKLRSHIASGTDESGWVKMWITPKADNAAEKLTPEPLTCAHLAQFAYLTQSVPLLMNLLAEYRLDLVNDYYRASYSGDERVIYKVTPFVDFEQGIHRFREASRQICRVDLPGTTGWGTGFLIGPRLVLTCWHVIRQAIYYASLENNQMTEAILTGDVTFEDSPVLQDLRFRFDYRTTSPTPRTYHLASGTEWRVAYSRKGDDPGNEDWIVLRLSERADLDLTPENEKRGFLRFPLDDTNAAYSFRKDDPLLILQHPNAQPLSYAWSVVKEFVEQPRPTLLHLVNTEGGSSGSPCFSMDMTPVALHQGYVVNDVLNRALPLYFVARNSDVRNAIKDSLAQCLREGRETGGRPGYECASVTEVAQTLRELPATSLPLLYEMRTRMEEAKKALKRAEQIKSMDACLIRILNATNFALWIREDESGLVQIEPQASTCLGFLKELELAATDAWRLWANQNDDEQLKRLFGQIAVDISDFRLRFRDCPTPWNRAPSSSWRSSPDADPLGQIAPSSNVSEDPVELMMEVRAKARQYRTRLDLEVKTSTGNLPFAAVARDMASSTQSDKRILETSAVGMADWNANLHYYIQMYNRLQHAQEMLYAVDRFSQDFARQLRLRWDRSIGPALKTSFVETVPKPIPEGVDSVTEPDPAHVMSGFVKALNERQTVNEGEIRNLYYDIEADITFRFGTATEEMGGCMEQINDGICSNLLDLVITREPDANGGTPR